MPTRQRQEGVGKDVAKGNLQACCTAHLSGLNSSCGGGVTLLLLLECFGTLQFIKGSWRACLQTRVYVTLELLTRNFFLLLPGTCYVW